MTPNNRSFSFLLASALALPLSAACVEDGLGDDPDDMPLHGADAGPGDDEPHPVKLRSGRIAITETTLSNMGDSFFGAVNVMPFANEMTRTVAQQEIGACTVSVFDVEAGDTEAELMDEGDITVTGTANGPFTCGFMTGSYQCQSTIASVRGGDLGNATGGTLRGTTNTFTLPGAAWPTIMEGMSIRLSGLPDPEANATFAILSVRGDALTLMNIDGSDIKTDETLGDADATYETFVGARPVPTGAAYLDDGSNDIVISKASGGVMPEQEYTIRAAGSGFALTDDADSGYVLPDAIPTTGGEVAFRCASCGPGVAPVGGQVALSIAGRTTDADLPPPGRDEGGIAMPPPVSRFATFECTVVGADEDTVSISPDAMAAILGTAPTRIELSVARTAGYHDSEAGFTSDVVVGHAVQGFTTVR